MIKRFAAALLMMTALAGAALAETLPGIDVFSPGLEAYRTGRGRNGAASTSLTLGVDQAFYVRDMSVLSAIFSGVSLETVNGGDPEVTGLTVSFRGEPMFSAVLSEDADGQTVAMNGRTMRLKALPPLKEGLPAALSGWLAEGGIRRFDRMPLERIETLLAGFGAEDAFFGCRLETPFQLSRTYSDDGQRFTRLDLGAAFACGDGSVWTLSGFLRRPGGKAPKDTAEITLAKDKDNAFTFTLSRQYKETAKRKGTQGQVSCQTRLKLDGELNGYHMTGTLSVTSKNDWTLADGALAERISVTTKASWRDKTPDRDKLHLDRDDLTLQETISLRTTDGKADAWADTGKLELTMDGETALAGSFSMRQTLGGTLPETPQGPAVPVTAQELTEEIRKAGQEAAALIWRGLDEKTKGRITKGL